MTDNQKSFGASRLFKIVGPIYYREPVQNVFLAWILHHIHQVLNTLSFNDNSGSYYSFIKHLPPFSRPMRSFLLGLFNTCLASSFLCICSFPIPDGLHALYGI